MEINETQLQNELFIKRSGLEESLKMKRTIELKTKDKNLIFSSWGEIIQFAQQQIVKEAIEHEMQNQVEERLNAKILNSFFKRYRDETEKEQNAN